MAKPEEKLHIALCDYLKVKYPKVIFISEASGVRLTIGAATKLKKMRSFDVHLDLYILEPLFDKKGEMRTAGLILELKARQIYKKDGELYSDQHLQDQQATITKLNRKGYVAQFVTSFDEGVKLIDKYMDKQNKK